MKNHENKLGKSTTEIHPQYNTEPTKNEVRYKYSCHTGYYELILLNENNEIYSTEIVQLLSPLCFYELIFGVSRTTIYGKYLGKILKEYVKSICRYRIILRNGKRIIFFFII